MQFFRVLFYLLLFPTQSIKGDNKKHEIKCLWSDKCYECVQVKKCHYFVLSKGVAYCSAEVKGPEGVIEAIVSPGSGEGCKNHPDPVDPKTEFPVPAAPTTSPPNGTSAPAYSPTASSSTSPPPSTTKSAGQESNEEGSNEGIYIGIGVGVPLVFVLVCCILCYLHLNRTFQRFWNNPRVRRYVPEAGTSQRNRGLGRQGEERIEMPLLNFPIRERVPINPIGVEEMRASTPHRPIVALPPNRPNVPPPLPPVPPRQRISPPALIEFSPFPARRFPASRQSLAESGLSELAHNAPEVPPHPETAAVRILIPDAAQTFEQSPPDNEQYEDARSATPSPEPVRAQVEPEEERVPRRSARILAQQAKGMKVFHSNSKR